MRTLIAAAVAIGALAVLPGPAAMATAPGRITEIPLGSSV
jgi:hypothetical protein